LKILYIFSLSLNPHFIFSLLRKQIIKIKALGGELRPIGSERLSLSLSLILLFSEKEKVRGFPYWGYIGMCV
jgi:hypothetical protein